MSPPFFATPPIVPSPSRSSRALKWKARNCAALAAQRLSETGRILFAFSPPSHSLPENKRPLFAFRSSSSLPKQLSSLISFGRGGALHATRAGCGEPAADNRLWAGSHHPVIIKALAEAVGRAGGVFGGGLGSLRVSFNFNFIFVEHATLSAFRHLGSA